MFNIHFSLAVFLFVSGVIAFGAAIPSFPGAVGVFELFAIAGFLVFGYPLEFALGFAVVVHLLKLSMTGIFGAWASPRDGQTILGLANKAHDFIREAQSQLE